MDNVNLINDFHNYLKLNTNLNERSIRNYVGVIKTFLNKYNEITVENMNDYIRQYPFARYVFKYFLAFLGRESDIFKLIKAKEKTREVKGVYLDKETILSAIQKLPEKERVIALIQFLTGARASEVIKISKENVSFEGDFIKIKLITKGWKERFIFIPVRYAEVVNYIVKSPFRYVFLEDNEIDERRVNTVYTIYYMKVKEAFTSVGINNFSTHDFRRNFINFIYNKTKDIVKTKTMVGHEKIETTFRYINKLLTHEELKKIIEEI